MRFDMLVAVSGLFLMCHLVSSTKPKASSAATCEGASGGSALLQQSSASGGAKFTAVQEHGPSGEKFIDKTQKQAAKGVVAAIVKVDRSGYDTVAQLKSDAHMTTFIRRVISSMKLIVIDEGPLNGLAPYYSGTKAAQSYLKLEQELTKISNGPCSWLAPVEGGATVFKSKKAALIELGCSAEISESGYAKVAQRKSDAQMKIFILRVISDMGRRPVVAAENALNGIVPYYSGSVATQNLEALKSELRRVSTGPCSWIIPTSAKVPDGIGRQAPLSEQGYLSVAQTYSAKEMRSFVERVITDKKMEVVDDNGLQGFLPYFDCEKDVKTFLKLEKELNEEANKGGGAWLAFSSQEVDSAKTKPRTIADHDASQAEETLAKNASTQASKQPNLKPYS